MGCFHTWLLAVGVSKASTMPPPRTGWARNGELARDPQPPPLPSLGLVEPQWSPGVSTWTWGVTSRAGGGWPGERGQLVCFCPLLPGPLGPIFLGSPCDWSSLAHTGADHWLWRPSSAGVLAGGSVCHKQGHKLRLTPRAPKQAQPQMPGKGVTWGLPLVHRILVLEFGGNQGPCHLSLLTSCPWGQGVLAMALTATLAAGVGGAVPLTYANARRPAHPAPPQHVHSLWTAHGLGCRPPR